MYNSSIQQQARNNIAEYERGFK